MKTLSLEQMEVINGGTMVAATSEAMEEARSGKVDCAISIGLALVTGTGGVILTAATGGAGIGAAIAFNWLTWAGAAYSCGRATGKI